VCLELARQHTTIGSSISGVWRGDVLRRYALDLGIESLRGVQDMPRPIKWTVGLSQESGNRE
jgi:hypothetical protein